MASYCTPTGYWTIVIVKDSQEKLCERCLIWSQLNNKPSRFKSALTKKDVALSIFQEKWPYRGTLWCCETSTFRVSFCFNNFFQGVPLSSQNFKRTFVLLSVKKLSVLYNVFEAFDTSVSSPPTDGYYCRSTSAVFLRSRALVKCQWLTPDHTNLLQTGK